MEDQIPIKLTKDEAMVLFDFLSRFTEKNELEIVDKSEKIVLWNLLAELESILMEPLEHSWREKLAKARLLVASENSENSENSGDVELSD